MADASVPLSAPNLQPRHKPTVSENQHRRRDLLGRIAGESAAAVPAASAVSNAAESGPDAELLRLGADCLQALWAWDVVEDEEIGEVYEKRYWSTLERVEELPAQTPAGLAIQLRIRFAQQCSSPWNAQAVMAMELTPEQLAEIDGADLALFRLAQTAMRIAAAGRA